jgi:hypothetical protein
MTNQKQTRDSFIFYRNSGNRNKKGKLTIMG